MTIFDERVRALWSLGFSERQTRFIAVVALHSGFCLRRHYAAFAGLRYGAGVRDFLDRLVSRRLARRLDFRPDRGHVYHLHNSSIYNAIRQDDNRNRRRTSPALIARKLMLLDYVLLPGDAEWCATEADKVELFTGRFGVPREDLPRRVYISQQRGAPPTIRNFIHKLPIGIVGEPPVPSFAFLVTDTNGQAFGQFLQDHLALLNRLQTWRIVAVAPRHIPGLPACEVAFRQFASSLLRPRPATEVDALETHFAVRERVERNDLRDISVSQIDEFRRMRQRFSSADIELLYQQWKVEGTSVLQTARAQGFLAALEGHRGTLTTYQLPIRYDRFGTLAGLV